MGEPSAADKPGMTETPRHRPTIGILMLDNAFERYYPVPDGDGKNGLYSANANPNGGSSAVRPGGKPDANKSDPNKTSGKVPTP